MRLRSKLMVGTALGLLAFAPLAASAQEAPAELTAAYQQYAASRMALTQAKASGDASAEAEAAIAARQNLSSVCESLGAASIGDCLDQYIAGDQRLPGDLDPIEVAPPAEIVPEVMPEAEPVPEVTEEPAPAPEMVAPEAEQAEPVAEPEVTEEAAPEPAMEAEPEVEAEKPAMEAAPEAAPEPAAEPAAEPVAEPAPEAAPKPETKQPSTQQPAVAPEPETKQSTDAAEPAADAAQPEMTQSEEPAEPIADADVAPEEVAPLLDSAKEEDEPVSAEAAADEPKAEAEPKPEVNQTAAEPAPKNDAEAQAFEAPREVKSIEAEKSESVAPQSTARRGERDERGERDSSYGRREQERPDRAKVVQEDDNGLRIVLQFGNQLILQNQDSPRLNRDSEDHQVENLRNGRTRETIERRNGVRIVTIYNRNGDILRRSRFSPDGRETVLAYMDESREEDLLDWRDPAEDLPPLRLNIPARDYILDSRDVDEDRLADFLDQPPVERVQRLYSVDEVKRSARIRDMVRRLEVGGLTFDSGKAVIDPNQINNMSKVANAMLELLDQNPAETFLIEGHTDAVGSDISNLELSDRRAETVAIVLSDIFGIPPENLATQGYGERYLKVRTESAERLNRRVTIRRITPLVAPVAQR